jgi:hypothetical protein
VNDEESLKAIMDWDATVRNRFGIFSWYVHHNRKATVGNKRPKSLDDLLGATVIAANCTSAYTLWREKPTDTEVEMINVKQRMGETEHPYFITSSPDLSWVERGILSDEIEYETNLLGLASTTPPDPNNTTLGF